MLITLVLPQETQRLFHADIRWHRAHAQTFAVVGRGRKYYLHDFIAVDVAVHLVTLGALRGRRPNLDLMSGEVEHYARIRRPICFQLSCSLFAFQQHPGCGPR